MPLSGDSLNFPLSATLTLLECRKLCSTETQVIAVGNAYCQALLYEQERD